MKRKILPMLFLMALIFSFCSKEIEKPVDSGQTRIKTPARARAVVAPKKIINIKTVNLIPATLTVLNLSLIHI